MSRPPRTVLLLALMGLAALFAGWFINDNAAGHPAGVHRAAAGAGLPLRLGWRKAGFWASVLALGWFSHGVMSAWSHPETRWLALIEIALALLVIFSASLPGLRARFGKRR